jgi:hypothetical protein
MVVRRNLEALLSQVEATWTQVGALRAQLHAMLEAGDDVAPHGTGPEYVDARGARELGLSRRAFLARAADGAFPTFRPDGKRILARRADVVGWLESRRVTPKRKEADQCDDVDRRIEEMLETGRLRPIPGGRSR